MPGYGGSADQPIVRAMAAQLKSVDIAPRSMAFSRKKPAGDFTPELDELRRVRDSLSTRDVTKLALVGRSFGGRICTRLAAIEPPDALVVLGHPISPPGHPRPDDEAALAAVKCPTLIVQGDRDRLGPVAVLRDIAAANTRIEIFVLADAGHQFGARQAEGLRHAAEWLVTTLEA
ncbi:MAG: dienelactone hydrolase family protein [Chloroflexi bacterium]|nr:dienelactone hydrolase family protein [Chloroflexota bacterium]